MSVLIKGIDKPKGCYECKIWSLCFNNPPINVIRYTYGKLDNCPIVAEIPTPHGRLIDADELLKYKTDHEMISTHLIWNAPTVVESEE